jgi:hypothetical protein
MLAEGLIVMAWCALLVSTILNTVIANNGAITGFMNDTQTASILQEVRPLCIRSNRL